jgi:hypothetical protein
MDWEPECRTEDIITIIRMTAYVPPALSTGSVKGHRMMIISEILHSLGFPKFNIENFLPFFRET